MQWQLLHWKWPPQSPCSSQPFREKIIRFVVIIIINSSSRWKYKSLRNQTLTFITINWLILFQRPFNSHSEPWQSKMWTRVSVNCFWFFSFRPPWCRPLTLWLSKIKVWSTITLLFGLALEITGSSNSPYSSSHLIPCFRNHLGEPANLFPSYST